MSRNDGWGLEGVRSVSEAFMHVAGANYFLTTTFGGEMPEGIGPDLEQRVTSKDEAVRVLRESVAHVEEVLAGVDESDLPETRQLFGRELTGYQVLLIILGHGHEHLGQAIAYARANGVVPPWSGGGEG
ncbi:MAG TPA: DinB family protein [Thermoanaerobaculia bacterium]|nr:DinB family protein [Thermoanaerobaculia bacterium]